MSKKIQIKRGIKAVIPQLAEGELGYTLDTNELFIGDGETNQKVGSVYFTTTIATGDWSGTDPVTATKTVSGILSTDRPVIDIDLSSVAFASVEDFQAEYGKIFRVAATDTDEITFEALEAPTEELIINIQVVR